MKTKQPRLALDMQTVANPVSRGRAKAGFAEIYRKLAHAEAVQSAQKETKI